MTTDLERLLLLFSDDTRDDLLWSGRGGTLAFAVQCSDTFYWGTADLEEVALPEDLESLERARNDAQGHMWWPTLWCARQRGMRPMRAWLEKYGELEDNGVVILDLLKAAGPERDPASEG